MVLKFCTIDIAQITFGLVGNHAIPLGYSCEIARLQTIENSLFQKYSRIVDSTWFVSGENLARDTFCMLGTKHRKSTKPRKSVSRQFFPETNQVHRESVSGWGGFSLGFRSTPLRTAAVFVPWI